MDFDRIGMLLQICNMTLGYPQLRKIHDTAFNEVLALQDPPQPVAEPERPEEPAGVPEQEPGDDAQAKLELNHEFRRR